MGFDNIVSQHASRVVVETAPSIMFASAKIAQGQHDPEHPVVIARKASRDRNLPKWKRAWLWIKAI